MKRLDITNEKFGKLTAIKRGQKKGKYSTWICKCECGTEKTIMQTHLIQGNIKSCGCLKRRKGENHPNWNGYGEISGNMWDAIARRSFRSKRQARKNIEFNLDIKDAWELFIRQDRKCALSGVDIVFGKNKTASLDRIDSSKGYTLENVQWVHKDVNKMKNVFDNSYFIEMCKSIARNNGN